MASPASVGDSGGSTSAHGAALFSTRKTAHSLRRYEATEGWGDQLQEDATTPLGTTTGRAISFRPIVCSFGQAPRYTIGLERSGGWPPLQSGAHLDRPSSDDQ